MTSHGRTFQTDMVLGKTAYMNESTSGWKRWTAWSAHVFNYYTV